MRVNELLEMKSRAQRTLSEQGGNDLRTYAQNLRRIVGDVERKHSIRFVYGPSSNEGVPSNEGGATDQRSPQNSSDAESGEQ